LSGCVSSRSAPSNGEHASVQSTDAFPLIIIDGDFADWPAHTPPHPASYTVAVADEHDLCMRFTIEGEIYTLQSDDASTAIFLDVDADASTGAQLDPTGDLSGLGVDLLIEFSPKQSNGRAGRGLALFALAQDGTRTPLNTHDWDFSFSPTYANDWYEARITRTPAGPVPVPTQGLLSTGNVAGAFVRYDASGSIAANSDVFQVALDVPCMTSTRRSNLTVPAKEPGTLRVVSYNVLRSKPNEVPDVYKRVFAALDPDVILVQEWEVGKAAELAEWFNLNMMREGGWDAVVAPGKVMDGAGVGIVSKFEAKTMSNDLRLEGTTTDPNFANNPVRYVLGEINTPMGTILAASVHLKSGGRAGSVEDRKRIVEAEAIKVNMRAMALEKKPVLMLVGGDYNLVGSSVPLSMLVEGADFDGSNLGIAQPRTLGDRTYVTWSEAGNDFTPGRLDFISYTDSKARVVRSFVLDTARLSDESLTNAGLESTDTARASDHLPVVVDLMPIR